MITQILSKNYVVLETNTVYLFDAYSDLNLHFNTGYDEFEFDVKLKFKTDEKTEDGRVKKYSTENEITFLFINFDNPFGSGTSKPVEIATINDKNVYMHVWIYGVGKNQNETTTRKVEYTVFMER